MRKRRFVVALVAGAATVGLYAACTISPLHFADTGLDAGEDAHALGDAGDASRVGANEDVDPSGKDRDATVIPDGDTGRVVAEAGCCDCDGDQVAAPDGGSCGGLRGGDCDDTIKYIYPGSDFVASSQWFSTHTPTFDWDCDGVVTVQYTHGLGACKTHSKASVALSGGCAGIGGGFAGDPACGAADTYILQCNNDGNLGNPNCTDGTVQTRTQGCR
jgi:hypothetical protein